MADALGQEIIWKYETPLQGKYLAAYTYGGIRPGLVSPLSVEQMATSSSITIPPFQAFLIPSNLRDTLIKVNQVLPVTLTISAPSAIAIGLTYTWEQDSSRLAEFEVLNESQLLDYPGIILCLFDRGTRRVYNQLADFTTEYWNNLGMTGCFFRPSLPRDSAFSLTTFQLSTTSGIATDYTLTVQYIVGADTYLKLVQPELTIDFSGLSANKYYLLGWKKTYNPQDPIPSTLPIEVIDNADSMSDLAATVNVHILAVVYWTGVTATSTVYQMLAGGVGANQAEDPTSATYRNMTLLENESDLYKFYADDKTVSIFNRESVLSADWRMRSQLNKSTVLGQYHTYDRNVFFGLGDRWYADHYRAAIGEIHPDVLKAFWWHCNFKGQTFNGVTTTGLIGNNPTADSQNLFPDGEILPFGSVLEIDGESVTVPPVLEENNVYWEKNHRFVKTSAQSSFPLSVLTTDSEYRCLIDFWCMLTATDSSLVSIAGDTYRIDVGQTGVLTPYNTSESPSIPPIIVEPSSVTYVTENGAYYRLDANPVAPGTVVYLYLDSSVSSAIEVFFENRSNTAVRVQLDIDSWIDVPPNDSHGSGLIVIKYIPGDPNPFAYGSLEYNIPAEGEIPYAIAQAVRLGIEVRSASQQLAIAEADSYPTLGQWHHVQLQAAFIPNLSLVFRIDDTVLQIPEVLLTSSDFSSVTFNRKDTILLYKELLTAILDSDVEHPEYLESYTAKLPWADIPEGSSPDVMSLITGKKDLRTDIFDLDAFKTAVEGILTDHHLI